MNSRIRSNLSERIPPNIAGELPELKSGKFKVPEEIKSYSVNHISLSSKLKTTKITIDTLIRENTPESRLELKRTTKEVLLAIAYFLLKNPGYANFRELEVVKFTLENCISSISDNKNRNSVASDYIPQAIDKAILALNLTSQSSG